MPPGRPTPAEIQAQDQRVLVAVHEERLAGLERRMTEFEANQSKMLEILHRAQGSGKTLVTMLSLAVSGGAAAGSIATFLLTHVSVR